MGSYFERWIYCTSAYLELVLLVWSRRIAWIRTRLSWMDLRDTNETLQIDYMISTPSAFSIGFQCYTRANLYELNWTKVLRWQHIARNVFESASSKHCGAACNLPRITSPRTKTSSHRYLTDMTKQAADKLGTLSKPSSISA